MSIQLILLILIFGTNYCFCGFVVLLWRQNLNKIRDYVPKQSTVRGTVIAVSIFGLP